MENSYSEYNCTSVVIYGNLDQLYSTWDTNIYIEIQVTTCTLKSWVFEDMTKPLSLLCRSQAFAPNLLTDNYVMAFFLCTISVHEYVFCDLSFQNIDVQTNMTDISGKDMGALEVFMLAIKYLTMDIFKMISNMNSGDAKFVIVVASHWNENTRRFLREVTSKVKFIHIFYMESWVLKLA